MDTKFEYLGVVYNPGSNWAEITLRPAVFSLSITRESGLHWIGKEGWELVSAVPYGVDKLGNPLLYLIFKKGK